VALAHSSVFCRSDSSVAAVAAAVAAGWLEVVIIFARLLSAVFPTVERRAPERLLELPVRDFASASER